MPKIKNLRKNNLFVNNEEISESNSLPMVLVGSANVIGGVVGVETNMVFADSAAEDAEITPIDFAQPSSPKDVTALIVYNPSTVTDITIQLFSYDGTHYSLITDINISAAVALKTTVRDTFKREIRGLWTNGGVLRVIASNDTVLAGDEGFTATIELRQV